MLLFHFFFFFQAEDGIRDVAVTGVQTCALPICDAPPDHAEGGGAGEAQGGRKGRGRESAGRQAAQRRKGDLRWRFSSWPSTTTSRSARRPSMPLPPRRSSDPIFTS